MYRDFFTFEPVAKFWLASNRKPIVGDSSEGFWRRVHLIPFTQSFKGREDRRLKDKLRAEAAGILAWAVRGCLAWQRDGLNPPDAVRTATGRLSTRERSAGALDSTRAARSARTGNFRRVPAFMNYEQWCARLHETRELNRRTFGEKMQSKFPPDPSIKRHTVYMGIALVTSLL